MRFRTIIITSIFIAIVSQMQAQTQVIAHRGFWKTEGSAQNSIAALLKADSIGCYGSEFDVWLTKDNELVVNHDPIYKMRSMEHSTLEELTKLRLNNGEELPSLEKYLKAAQKTNTRLILELKKLRNERQETTAVEKIVKLIKLMNLEQRVEYISFSLHAVKEFIRLAPPKTPVFYLGGELTPQELKELGCAGPDYQVGIFKKHPEWIMECHKLGMKANVWTVDKEEDMKWLIKLGIDFITTNEPLILQKQLK